MEPVILHGSQLPQLSNVDITDLYAYSNIDGNWVQIPLQFDEVDLCGIYGPEEGLLDADDELVFMAMDQGEMVD